MSIPSAFSTSEKSGMPRTALGNALWKAEAASEVREAASLVTADAADPTAEVTELRMEAAGAGAACTSLVASDAATRSGAAVWPSMVGGCQILGRCD